MLCGTNVVTLPPEFWGDQTFVVQRVDDVKHPRKVDKRLPGKDNSDSHGARPVHQIIPMIKWIRTSRLSIKNSLSLSATRSQVRGGLQGLLLMSSSLLSSLELSDTRVKVYEP